MKTMVKLESDNSQTMSPSKSKANMIGWTNFNTGQAGLMPPDNYEMFRDNPEAYSAYA